MERKKLEESINKRCEELNEALLSFCDNGEKGIKKSELITYWIKDYTKYLKFENEFKPKKLKKYKRGDVIKINLGFNLGNEEGGLHYAVVIDNNNSQASGVVTVVPLSSLKEDEKLSHYDVSLGAELNTLIEKKLNNKIEELKKDIDKANESVDKIVEYIEKLRKGKDLSAETLEILNEEMKKSQKMIELNNKNLKYVKKMKKEFDRMNVETKALVGQITTVSKMRIYDPKTSWDVLAEIKLSPEQLNKINDKIKELYIYSVDK